LYLAEGSASMPTERAMILDDEGRSELVRKAGPRRLAASIVWGACVWECGTEPASACEGAGKESLADGNRPIRASAIDRAQLLGTVTGLRRGANQHPSGFGA